MLTNVNIGFNSITLPPNALSQGTHVLNASNPLSGPAFARLINHTLYELELSYAAVGAHNHASQPRHTRYIQFGESVPCGQQLCNSSLSALNSFCTSADGLQDYTCECLHNQPCAMLVDSFNLQMPQLAIAPVGGSFAQASVQPWGSFVRLLPRQPLFMTYDLVKPFAGVSRYDFTDWRDLGERLTFCCPAHSFCRKHCH